MSYQLPHWVWPAALMTVCVLAVWRGRDDERLAAGGLLANWAISLVVANSHGEATQWDVLVVDTALLGLYVWLALRSPRHWPLFAAGFQLLIVLTHFGRAADPRVSGWAYLLLLTIAYGAWTAPAHPPGAADNGGDVAT